MDACFLSVVTRVNRGRVEISVRANRKVIDKAQVLDDLDETLTNSSKVAASLGDEFLVYLIDMAVLHVRKKAIHLEIGPEQPLRALPSEPIANFEFARRHLSSLASGIRSVAELQSSLVQ